MSRPTIRMFQASDIEFALEQTEREGWDTTGEVFQTCLAHDPDGCFIAELDGQRVGTVTVTRFHRSGWIGNLIVVPEQRRRGIGESLMTHAMAHLESRGVKTMRLEADPPGHNLYCRLGFVDELESSRFRFESGSPEGAAAIEGITPEESEGIEAFDTDYFGDERGRLLSLLLQCARGTYCLRQGNRIQSYALALPSRFGVRIGPWVASSDAAAGAALQAILADWPETTILLGLPETNHRGVRLLESHGFTRDASCIRMVHGPPIASGEPEGIYAIANGAMG